MLKAPGFVNEYAQCCVCHKIESDGNYSPSLTAKDLLRFSNILIARIKMVILYHGLMADSTGVHKFSKFFSPPRRERPGGGSGVEIVALDVEEGVD